MSSRSLDNRQLSRSKIADFLECPRCFYEDVALGISRVSPPGYTLNLAVDRLLKSEFDAHRAAGTPHPLFATVGLDAVPFAHAALDTWRSNRSGVRWTDPDTCWTLYGAIDDLWVTPAGRVIVADYKATAKAKDVTVADIYPRYRQQLEIYQFLVSSQDLDVDSRAWLVYANGRGDRPAFGATLAFRMSLLPCDGDSSWVAVKFRAAVALLERNVPPAPAPACKWCAYVERRNRARAPVLDEAAAAGSGAPA